MVTVGYACKVHILLSTFACPGDEKPPQAAKMICWRATSVNHQLFIVGHNLEKNSFLTERCGNVVENKGPPWKTWERGGNVYENKGAYPHETGMLLKRKGVKSRQRRGE